MTDTTRQQLMEELVQVHTAWVAQKGLTISGSSLAVLRRTFEHSSLDRIRQEIVAKRRPPPDPIDREELMRKRKKEHLEWAQRVEEDRKRQEEERLAYEEEKRNFSEDNYEGFKYLNEGSHLKGHGLIIVNEIRSNGDLCLRFYGNSISRYEKHISANKSYTFEIDIREKGKINYWNLKAEEHECYIEHLGHGADLILIYEGGHFNFDLDS